MGEEKKKQKNLPPRHIKTIVSNNYTYKNMSNVKKFLSSHILYCQTVKRLLQSNFLILLIMNRQSKYKKKLFKRTLNKQMIN